MLNKRLLDLDIQNFIRQKSDDNSAITTLVLGKNPFPEVPIQEIAAQVNGRQKALKKFPLWAQTTNCYYPPNLNLEQTSSEITATYKSTLVSGDTLLDVTGGFGIDTYYFSKRTKHVIHCELNAQLSAISMHNFAQLNALNIICENGDGLAIIKKQEQKLDWIYIDPSRRNSNNSKVFFLEDCLPNVPDNLNLIFNKSTNILLKTAPLLDIKAGLRSLQYVKEIHIIAIQNDVKEVLWVLHKEYAKSPLVKTVNYATHRQEKFDFNLQEESVNTSTLNLPSTYLYEPNAAILKSGAFSSISSKLHIDKLHINTHLYTSEKLLADFPGRTFRIQKMLPYSKKELKKLEITKANITTRNFPESVVLIRKKHKIKDGGNTYLFFTTILDQRKVVLICQKV